VAWIISVIERATHAFDDAHVSAAIARGPVQQKNKDAGRRSSGRA
jgi:hypothetical protein